MASHIIHSITEASQIGEARRSATRLAEAAGFRETEKGQVAIVVTELATNLVRHAKEGKIFLRSVKSATGSAIEILTTDRGPGRADFNVCLADGYSTAGTPGNGLGAVKRMSRTFDFFSVVGAGTVVLAQVADRTPTGAVKSRFEWGAISIAVAGETVCGDAWSVEEQDGRFRAMVADGLGHGPGAAEAANKACDVFAEAPTAPPKVFLEKCHTRMMGTRGAVVAIATASDNSEELEFAGVGNISGGLHSLNDSRGLMSYNGTVGAQMRSVQQLKYPWPTGAILVMYSDGLKSHWSFREMPGLINRHPAVIAAVLLRDQFRGKDDASIVVVRRHPK